MGVFLQWAKKQHVVAVARVQQQNDALRAQARATANKEISWRDYLDRMNEQQKADVASAAPNGNTFEFEASGWISFAGCA